MDTNKFILGIFNNPDLGSFYQRPEVTVIDASSTSLPAAPVVTIDGVALQLYDRVLFTALSDADLNNRIYKVDKSRDLVNLLFDLVTDGQSSDGSPAVRDMAAVRQGTYSQTLWAFDGSAWVNVDLDFTATGDFQKDGSVAATGNFNLGSHKITSLAAGTDSTDAANFGQVSGVASASLHLDGSNSPSANISWNSKKITSLTSGASSGEAVEFSQLNKTAVGLSNVTNDAQVKVTDRGAVSGVAELDASRELVVAQAFDEHTTVLYVDGNRGDSYTEDGSLARPFKTIQAAINAVASPSATHKHLIEIAPGAYYTPDLTVDKVYTTFRSCGLQGARISGKITVTNPSSPTPMQITFVGLRISGGFECLANHTCINVVDCNVTGSTWVMNPAVPADDEFLQVFSGLWYADATLTNIYAYLMGGGYYSTFTVSGKEFNINNADINDPFTALLSGTLVGSAFGNRTGNSKFTLNAGVNLHMDADTEGGSVITLAGGALTRSTKGGNISNDSTVTGTTVKDALSTLDSSKEPSITGGTSGQYWRGDKSFQSLNLSALSDVTITLPTVDQSLRYNGSDWVNVETAPVSAGPSSDFFFIDTNIVPGPTVPTSVKTWSKTPGIGGEHTDSTAVTNETKLIQNYLYNAALGGTQIDSGVWDMTFWAFVDTLDGVNQIKTNICQVIAGAGTADVTGSDPAFRTVTITGGTPFVAGDASAAVDVATYLQLPSGIFQIITFTSSSVVDIAIPVGYSNDSSAAYSRHVKLFQDSVLLTSVPAISYTTISVQPAFPLSAGDRMSCFVFADTTSLISRTIGFIHDGTARNSYIITPLIIRHNDLSAVQGGTANEEYHLNLAEHTVATQAATASLNGYLSSSNWSTFNGKEPAISAGTSSQYWRGDKSWQALNWAAVDKTTSSLADITTRSAGDLSTGTLDGDRLPVLSATKRGGVKETGTPSGLFLKDSDSWSAVTATDVGLSNVTNDAQVKKADYTALGDILYGTGPAAEVALTGNQTLTKKFLNQTGDGAGHSAAPSWDAVTKTDVGLSNVPNTDCTNASNISSGTLDGDLLPAISASKKGAVPATGTPSGLFLKDDGSWAAVGGVDASSLSHDGTTRKPSADMDWNNKKLTNIPEIDASTGSDLTVAVPSGKRLIVKDAAATPIGNIQFGTSADAYISNTNWVSGGTGSLTMSGNSNTKLIIDNNNNLIFWNQNASPILWLGGNGTSPGITMKTVSNGNSAFCYLNTYATGVIPSGSYQPRSVRLTTDTSWFSNGIILAAKTAGAPIQLWTDEVQRMQIDSTGVDLKSSPLKGLVEEINFSFPGTTAANGTYILVYKAKVPCVINEVSVATTAGTCTLETDIAGSAVHWTGDVTTLPVTSSDNTISMYNNTGSVAAGQQVTIVITANAASTNLAGTFKTTRT